MLPANLDNLTASSVKECWREGREAISDRIIAYERNLRYLDTEHMLQWLIGQAEGFGDGREMWTSNNQMAANLQRLIAMHVSRMPRFTVPAVATDDAAVEAAGLASNLVEALWAERGVSASRLQALWFAYASGTAGCWVDWDGAKETTVETYCSVDEMVFTPGAATAERAPWGIKRQLLPPLDVQSMYPAVFGDGPPSADVLASATPVVGSGLLNRGAETTPDLVSVLTLYVRPTAIYPLGGYAVVVGNQIVERGPWPYPFDDRLPVAVLRQIPYAERWAGRTIIDRARPIQGMIDRVTSYLLMGVRDVSAPILEFPQSMAEQSLRLDGAPGQRMLRNDGSEGARFVQPGSWSNDPFVALRELKAALADTMNMSDAARGQPVPSLESGRGYEVLQSADLQPLSMFAAEEAAFWSDTMSLVVSMHSVGVVTPRLWYVSANGAKRAAPWDASALQGITRVEVPSRSLDPNEKRLLEQVVLAGVGANNISISQAARLMKMSTLDEAAEELHPDEHAARRENERFFALDSKVRMAEATGDPMLVQAVLAEAPVPTLYDDDEIHMMTHTNDFKSARYRNLHPLVQDVFEMHMATHERKIADRMRQAGEMRAESAAAAAGPQAQLEVVA